jgi:hypothetical protein
MDLASSMSSLRLNSAYDDQEWIDEHHVVHSNDVCL